MSLFVYGSRKIYLTNDTIWGTYYTTQMILIPTAVTGPQIRPSESYSTVILPICKLTFRYSALTISWTTLSAMTGSPALQVWSITLLTGTTLFLLPLLIWAYLVMCQLHSWNTCVCSRHSNKPICPLRTGVPVWTRPVSLPFVYSLTA